MDTIAAHNLWLWVELYDSTRIVQHNTTTKTCCHDSKVSDSTSWQPFCQKLHCRKVTVCVVFDVPKQFRPTIGNAFGSAQMANIFSVPMRSVAEPPNLFVETPVSSKFCGLKLEALGRQGLARSTQCLPWQCLPQMVRHGVVTIESMICWPGHAS